MMKRVALVAGQAELAGQQAQRGLGGGAAGVVVEALAVEIEHGLAGDAAQQQALAELVEQQRVGLGEGSDS